MVEGVSKDAARGRGERTSSRAEGGRRTRGDPRQNLQGRPLVSVITVVLNGAVTLEDTIRSVSQQTYGNIEHIIIDGGSGDGTLDLIRKYDAQLDYWLTEPDAGLYDAMNKGIALASGDYVGMLNGDDIFASAQSVQKIVERLLTGNLDAVFSQLDVVNPHNPLQIIRKYRVARFNTFMLRIGVMPPHPTFYCRRSCYQTLGVAPYRTDYQIAADFELLVRLLVTQKISWGYLAETTIKMRAGGISSGSYKSRLLLNQEIIRACVQNGLYTNMWLLLLKVPLRLWERIRHE
ncbi:MAG: glycosyltransferase family 2 protein [Acidiferrobacteraceae bacterium]